MCSNSCFYHVRRLHQIRRSTGNDVMIQLVVTFDYCNAVLAGLPWTAIEPLQRAANAATRLVFGLWSSDHITPALAQLHWLPVRFRINFKQCLLMHRMHVGRCPSYLAALVSSSADNCRRSGLRLASSSSYTSNLDCVQNLVKRAFSLCGPAEWNCLPQVNFRWLQTWPVLKRHLKHIFTTKAFCIDYLPLF